MVVQAAEAKAIRATPNAGAGLPVRRTVYLMGASLGTGNRGVSALGASLVKLVRLSAPGAEPALLIGSRTNQPFDLFLGDRKLRIPIANFRLSPRARMSEQLVWWFLFSVLYRVVPVGWVRNFLSRKHPLIHASAEAVMVGDIRGGDSFSDIYGLKNFLQGSLEVLPVILVRGTIALFPQTYGPYKTSLARTLARFILRRASVILSRDCESLATVKDLIGETSRCRFCPDVAFALEARPPKQFLTIPPLNLSTSDASPSTTLVGLNVNGLMFNGGYTRKNMFGLKLDYAEFLAQLIRALLGDPAVRVLLVPHTFAPAHSVESDPEACRKVRGRLSPELQPRVHLVEGEYDQSEIKWVIGQCGFFVGSRMHSCIAALSQGIPAVGVAYSKKFAGVFDSVGAAGWVVDGRELAAEQGVAKAMEIYRRREALREPLAEKVREAQATLYRTFQELFSSRDESLN